MSLSQVLVSQCTHDWHGALEGVNEISKLLLDRVRRQGLVQSVGNLGVMISLFGNGLIIDVDEEGLLIDVLKRLPFLE